MMKDKILIFGKGFIGERIEEFFGCESTQERIVSLESAQREIDKYKPSIIINCIGYTGKNNVDGCELDKEKTLFANSFVPLVLAEAALRNNIKLIHISSGCIYKFDYAKDKPISEDIVPDFFDLYYSRSKIYTERALDTLSHGFNILIPRIRIPLDHRPHPRNILTKLIEYKKVIDLPNSCTYLPDFLQALKHLIKVDAKGIFNIVNKGGLVYPELLDAYKKYVPGFQYEKIPYAKLGVGKRTNLLMSVEKLEKTGFKMRDIREVFDECIQRYLNY